MEDILTVKEFLTVCDESQNLLIRCDDIASGFVRCRAEMVGGFFVKRIIKNLYTKHNGGDIEIVIEV